MGESDYLSHDDHSVTTETTELTTACAFVRLYSRIVFCTFCFFSIGVLKFPSSKATLLLMKKVSFSCVELMKGQFSLHITNRASKRYKIRKMLIAALAVFCYSVCIHCTIPKKSILRVIEPRGRGHHAGAQSH